MQDDDVAEDAKLVISAGEFGPEAVKLALSHSISMCWKVGQKSDS